MKDKTSRLTPDAQVQRMPCSLHRLVTCSAGNYGRGNGLGRGRELRADWARRRRQANSPAAPSASPPRDSRSGEQGLLFCPAFTTSPGSPDSVVHYRERVNDTSIHPHTNPTVPYAGPGVEFETNDPARAPGNWPPPYPRGEIAATISLVYHGLGITMADVVAGPDRLVAVGHFLFGQQFGQGTAWTSPDGKTWTRMPDQASFGQGEPQAVIPDGAGYVATGTSGAGQLHPDGLAQPLGSVAASAASQVSGLDALLTLHVVDGPAPEDNRFVAGKRRTRRSERAPRCSSSRN